MSLLSPIKNFKCRFLPLDRSVCPILLTDALPSLFGSERFTSTVSPSLPRASSFAIAVVLVWHRSARSNLINSCKFNYWLTAPRLRALYLLLAPPRASTSSCLAFLFFFIPFFSFTVPYREQTHLDVRRFCEPPPRNLQFLGETLWGTRNCS